MTKVTWSPAQKADAEKIENLLNEVYPDGTHPFNLATAFTRSSMLMAKHLIDNGIGDITILTRQLQESERFREVDRKILDDYVDREYNPENPDFEERI